MKRIVFLLIAGACGLLLAQTNSLPPAPAEQEIGLHSDHFFFNGKARQLVYYDHVVVTNLQGSLACERLTVFLPPEGVTGARPRVTADTNVVIRFTNGSQTNRLTCDQAIYEYRVVNAVTNETITFTGHARVADEANTNNWMTGEPLVWDNVIGGFRGSNVQGNFSFPASGVGTNNTFQLF